MAKINIVSVRFVDEAKIQIYGEKTGLSNVRVQGGNDMPVEHTMIYDTETAILTIYCTRSNTTPIMVPREQIKWMEEDFGTVVIAPQPVPPTPARKQNAKPTTKQVMAGLDDD